MGSRKYRILPNDGGFVGPQKKVIDVPVMCANCYSVSANWPPTEAPRRQSQTPAARLLQFAASLWKEER